MGVHVHGGEDALQATCGGFDSRDLHHIGLIGLHETFRFMLILWEAYKSKIL